MSSLKSVIAILLVVGISVLGCTSNQTGPGKTAGEADKDLPAQTSKMEKDVVCGMGVDPESPDTLKAEYQGKVYYFCSDMCKKTFEASPEKYAHATDASGAHQMQMQE